MELYEWELGKKVDREGVEDALREDVGTIYLYLHYLSLRALAYLYFMYSIFLFARGGHEPALALIINTQ